MRGNYKKWGIVAVVILIIVFVVKYIKQLQDNQVKDLIKLPGTMAALNDLPVAPATVIVPLGVIPVYEEPPVYVPLLNDDRIVDVYTGLPTKKTPLLPDPVIIKRYPDGSFDYNDTPSKFYQ